MSENIDVWCKDIIAESVPGTLSGFPDSPIAAISPQCMDMDDMLNVSILELTCDDVLTLPRDYIYQYQSLQRMPLVLCSHMPLKGMSPLKQKPPLQNTNIGKHLFQRGTTGSTWWEHRQGT